MVVKLEHVFEETDDGFFKLYHDYDPTKKLIVISDEFVNMFKLMAEQLGYTIQKKSVCWEQFCFNKPDKTSKYCTQHKFENRNNWYKKEEQGWQKVDTKTETEHKLELQVNKLQEQVKNLNDVSLDYYNNKKLKKINDKVENLEKQMNLLNNGKVVMINQVSNKVLDIEEELNKTDEYALSLASRIDKLEVGNEMTDKNVNFVKSEITRLDNAITEWYNSMVNQKSEIDEIKENISGMDEWIDYENDKVLTMQKIIQKLKTRLEVK